MIGIRVLAKPRMPFLVKWANIRQDFFAVCVIIKDDVPILVKTWHAFFS